MSEATSKTRKRFTNIHIAQIIHYRLPLAGLVSILHRGLVSGWFVKLVILALSWAYLHHFCAGVRHLVMDAHIGLSKEGARQSATAVFAVSVPLALLV
eukprot:gene8690-11625_t